MDETAAQKIINDTRDLYNTIAQDFSVTRDKVSADLSFVAGFAADAERVLDVGCGNGRLLPLLPVSVKHYCGVDQSDELIADAENRYTTQVASGRAQFVEGNMLDLESLALSGPFDLVYAPASLHHIPSWGFRQRALLQMADQLKTDGKLVLLNWNLHSDYAKDRYKLDFSRVQPGYDEGDVIIPWKDLSGGVAVEGRYCHAFTLDEMEKLAAGAGLVVEKNEYIKDGKPSIQQEAKFILTICLKQ